MTRKEKLNQAKKVNTPRSISNLLKVGISV